MSCQSHRHEPAWWLREKERCRGTVTRKHKTIFTRGRMLPELHTVVEQRQCRNRLGYCRYHDA